MSRYNKSRKRDWKHYLQQVLAAAAAIFIIIWFLPHNTVRQLSYEFDRPWNHEQLFAPFDFPVSKSAAQQQFELDSIRREYSPYFEENEAVEKKQITAFRDTFRLHHSADLPNDYRIFIEKRLHTVYARGVTTSEDLRRLRDEGTLSILVYKGNDGRQRRISRLFSPKTAYEYLVAEVDSAGIQRSKLQHLNLNQFIHPNLRFDEAKSTERWENMRSSLLPNSGYIVEGQSIIERGKVVDAHDTLVLSSYYKELVKRNAGNSRGDRLMWGQLLYVSVIIICLVVYFNLFRRDYISSWRSVLLMSVLVLSFTLLTCLLIRHMWMSVYMIPYAMLPVFIRVFMDSRTAFFTYVCTILLCAAPLNYPFSFIPTQLMSGLVAIYSLRELSERSQIFRTAILSTFVTLVMYIALELLQNNITTESVWEGIMANINTYRYIITSGVLLLFAYPLMYLLERLFGFTSNVTLVELSNVNRPLLRSLSEIAPGTFQHSIMVSNLAAEVANKIDAKAQLVRTGALYHDIGKMENPEFFTENQLGGINPHSNLSNRESAAIILRHVTDGLALADRYELPRVIRDFIATHHGHGMAKYFYITEQNAHPDAEVNVEDFTYAGPNPRTTEQAILMMCDAVEASARSLNEYTEENIGQLVDRIIDGQVAEGYFRLCPITFLDIETAKSVLKERLKSIYHTRVSYPTLTVPVAELGTPPSGSHS